MPPCGIGVPEQRPPEIKCNGPNHIQCHSLCVPWGVHAGSIRMPGAGRNPADDRGKPGAPEGVNAGK
jgi:hypothetical protein